jgi:Protein of unknown function (DUF1822)
MTNYMTETALDFEVLSAETLDLLPAHFDQALQLSNNIADNEQQWQAYLNALGMFAFEQWLLDRAPEMSVSREHCADAIETAAQLRVQGFKLYLTAMGSLTDEAIALPQTLVDTPADAAHFYVVVEVMEELEIARIRAFICRDRLVEICPQTRDRAYSVSLREFENDPDTLLLYFRALDPAVIPLPQPATSVSQRMVNVAVWLQDRLDDVARDLSWVLLPAFSEDQLRYSTASGMRSPVAELDDILSQLQRGGTRGNYEISSDARGAYQDFPLADTRLRLYVVTWAELSPENVPEWKLVLVLGTPSGESLSNGTCLRVSDDTQLLVEKIMNSTTDSPYLYTRVAGTWDETFTITISLINGASITLPPFAFSL